MRPTANLPRERQDYEDDGEEDGPQPMWCVAGRHLTPGFVGAKSRVVQHCSIQCRNLPDGEKGTVQDFAAGLHNLTNAKL